MLLLRAYVPAGFMPESGNPFALKICHMAMAMEMPAPHDHSKTQGDSDTCLFGNAPAAGPLSHIVHFQVTGRVDSAVASVFEPVRLGARIERAHQPRAPPLSPA